MSQYDGFVASMNVAGPSLANLYVAGVPIVDEVRVLPIAAVPRRKAQLTHWATRRSSATGASGRRVSPPRTASTATSLDPSRQKPLSAFSRDPIVARVIHVPNRVPCRVVCVSLLCMYATPSRQRHTACPFRKGARIRR